MIQAIAYPVTPAPPITGRVASLETGGYRNPTDEFEDVLTQVNEPAKKETAKQEVRDEREDIQGVDSQKKSQEQEQTEDSDLLDDQETAVVIEVPVKKEVQEKAPDPEPQGESSSPKDQTAQAMAVASSSQTPAGDAEALLKLLGVSQVIAKPLQANMSVQEAGAALVSTSGGATTGSDASSTGATKVPLAPASNMEPNIARVARALQNAIQHKGGTVTLRMSPPELGMVRVDVTVKAGVVSVQFRADHESIQNLMNRELSQLRQALQRQGLTVDRLEVQNRASSSSSSFESQNQDNQSTSDGRSRGEYARPEDQTNENQTTENQFEEVLNEVV